MPNALAHATSPYLLQHAHNPVDWREWGPQAFAVARERGLPIFLSIGYSTCYWCHVMERESFESEDIARLMNDRFIPIKVDREERPDIDDIYMAATQIMTGRGGWPMSVFLEPETLKPFYTGTYFPPEPRHGIPSFPQVLQGLSGAWNDRRGEVLQQAEKLAGEVSAYLAAEREPVAVGERQIGQAVGALLQMHDTTDGGFGGAPKFPQPVYLDFLLEVADAADETTRNAIDTALTRTLDRMAIGGLFDQAGGGFHRYCVDKTWTVPHFEKMLYDNAQLASVYCRAAAVYNDPFYARIARRTLDYVLREMTDDTGRFFSAQDAEVAGHEGLNYLWTKAEVDSLLDDELYVLAKELYDLDHPNFQDPHHPGDAPKAVLRLADRPDKLAQKHRLSEAEFVTRLGAINDALLAARRDRVQPHTDDKTLAAWTGMMIVALLDGYALLGEERYADAAQKAGDFVLAHMRAEGGLLVRAWRDGKSSGPGVLEDHACVLRALLALHTAGLGDGKYREAARELAEVTHGHFADAEGVYHDTTEAGADTFVRPRTFYDGATPSGASTMLNALVSFARADAQGPWLDRAVALTRALSAPIADQPVSAINATRALLRLLQIDPKLAQKLAENAREAEVMPDKRRQAQPVEVYADTERVTVTSDQPGEVNLVIRVAEGYHIFAAEPALAKAMPLDAVKNLIPLRVGLVSGQGVAVYADYPEGEPYGKELIGEDDLRVHTDTIELRVALEKADGVGPTPGNPILGITVQACTETECLEPQTFELDVAIDVT